MFAKNLVLPLISTILVLILIFSACSIKSNNTTVEGYFLESEHGLPLNKAKIYLMEDLSNDGNGSGSILQSTYTNEEGYFKIDFPAEKGKVYRIDFSGNCNGVNFSGSRKITPLMPNTINWYLNQETPRLKAYKN